jgi:hypothetical protein
MITFESERLKLQFGNERYFYGLFKLMVLLLSVAFYHKFGESFHVTSIGRSYNPKSAHFDGDKLVCAVDVRTKNLTLEQIKWLANQDAYLHPYVDIVMEDHRMSGKEHRYGDHCHIELNPSWWIKF